MRAYLSGRGLGTSLTDIHADVLRPAADKLIASDYVKGTFRDGGTTYDFAANAVTGAVWTSERLPEFEESCLRRVCDLLGLDAGQCAGSCTLWVTVPAWETPRAEWDWETAYLGAVVPVDVSDMDAYAAEVLASDGDTRMAFYLACVGADLSDARWQDLDLSPLRAADITLCAVDTLPAEVGYDFVQSHSGEQLTLRGGEIVYTPGT
jgi:hypothetical protein